MMENNTKKNNSEAPVKPDAETLHTTDPQDEMKGPVSSFMNNLKDDVEEEGRKINPDPKEDE